ncbi:alpha-1,6-mannosyltransferase [Parafrankia irregularis]|uniref:Alpha-1,6-mannosyltransferase n=1 Tax=Parafrankia irregularis TaxID=795642 RepID=A0A0S4QSF8_9ACTN|nr:polyprenol phosphomannose-dependent alpha 1,6 mannosyltransferase MptB [Parafrankia irregularis]CUU58549.1 alpha-1,6-mannosyltransferase [Parafrankia irregularis]
MRAARRAQARGSTRERPGRPRLAGVAFLGLVGSCLVVATGGRLARQPLAEPPTTWGGLLNPVSTDSMSVLPALLIGGIALTLAAWVRAYVLAESHRLSARAGLVLLALWMVPVTFGPPILSLDVYSYAAHGMMLATSLDPYSTAPVALPLGSPQITAVDPLWRSSLAPYGPLALAVFRAVHTLTGGSLIGAVVVLRLLTLAGVALVAAGVLALAAPQRRAESLVLAVGNPIVLFQLLGAIHLEAIMMALVVIGLVAIRRGRRTLGLVLLAAAAAVKWPAALAAAAVVAWQLAPEPRPRGHPPATPPTPPTPVAADTPATPATPTAGEATEAPPLARRLRTALCDVAVVLLATAGFAALVPDGLGWLRSAATPTTVPTGYSPTSILAHILGRILDAAGAPRTPDHLLSLSQALALAACALIIARLFVTISSRPVADTAGWAMLTLALLGPVLHPWYLVWGLILLAIAPTGRNRLVVLGTTLAGSFLALQQCSLLLADHPEMLRWVRSNGPVVAVTGYVTAAALVIAFRQRTAGTAGWPAAPGRSVPGHPGGPDDMDRLVSAPRVGDDVTRARVASRGLTVPDRDELVHLVDQRPAGAHQRLQVNLRRQRLPDPAGRDAQPVVHGSVLRGQEVAVVAGGHDHDELTAEAEHQIGEHAVGPLGQAAHPDEVPGRIATEQPTGPRDRVLLDGGRKGAVAGDSHDCHHRERFLSAIRRTDRGRPAGNGQIPSA